MKKNYLAWSWKKLKRNTNFHGLLAQTETKTKAFVVASCKKKHCFMLGKKYLLEIKRIFFFFLKNETSKRIHTIVKKVEM
jgi:hypothetical protein